MTLSTGFKQILLFLGQYTLKREYLGFKIDKGAIHFKEAMTPDEITKLLNSKCKIANESSDLASFDNFVPEISSTPINTQDETKSLYEESSESCQNQS